MKKILTKIKSFFRIYFPHALLLTIIAMLMMWYTDQQYGAGEQTADARLNKLESQVDNQTQIIQNVVDSAAQRITTNTDNQLSQIDGKSIEKTTIIEKQIQDNPKMSSTDDGLSDDMLKTINAARAETNP